MKKLFLIILTLFLLIAGTLPASEAFSSYNARALSNANAANANAVNARATLPRAQAQQSTPTATVPLSGSYACVLEDNSYFYSMPDEKRGIFLLPKTYYVKVLDYQPDYCKIEYLYDDTNIRKITGYARTADLTFVEYVPKRPYLYYIFDVRYEIGDTQINDSAFLTQLTVTCAYYGDFKLGTTTYCYVLRGDTFGYVPKPDNLSYEENTEYADYLAQQTAKPSDNEKTPNTNKSSPAQIAILIALCLLVPVLAALILKQPKHAFDYEADECT